MLSVRVSENLITISLQKEEVIEDTEEQENFIDVSGLSSQSKAI